ncbi:MAG: hypothetical protein HQL96_07440 [Magnetococcales bacterium]|nr:hypothetical protein [Magnetococcales bacterium]
MLQLPIPDAFFETVFGNPWQTIQHGLVLQHGIPLGQCRIPMASLAFLSRCPATFNVATMERLYEF